MSEYYTDRIERELDVAQGWAKAWKGLAKVYRSALKNQIEPDRMFAAIARSAIEDPEFGKDTIGKRVVEILAWAFQDLLSNHPEGKNYIECSLHAGDGGPDVYVTIHRPGGKTPHQMRMDAEAERDKLRSELESLKAQGPCRS